MYIETIKKIIESSIITSSEGSVFFNGLNSVEKHAFSFGYKNRIGNIRRKSMSMSYMFSVLFLLIKKLLISKCIIKILIKILFVCHLHK